MTKIELEYREHEVQKELRDKIPDGEYLEMNIDDILKELAKTSARLYIEDLRNRASSKFRRIIGKVVPEQIELAEFLEKDSDYVLELLIHIADTSEIFAEIKDAISEANLEELIKLTDFAVEKYTENYNFLAGQRKALLSSLNGITMIDNSLTDTREETKDFIRQQIGEATSYKHLEKKN